MNLKMPKHNAGVYVISSPSGKRYVGSSVNVKKRLLEHIRNLDRGTHKNIILQRAADKYGLKSLKFEQFLSVIEVSKKALFEYEQIVVEELSPEMNILPIAGSVLGYRHSAEMKAAMSERRAAEWADPEIRQRRVYGIWNTIYDADYKRPPRNHD
jgi:group I intron endonuclease